MGTMINDDLKNIASRLVDEATALEGKTILVSGGSGFLGKYIVTTLCYLNDNLLQKPSKIISIDNLKTSTNTPYFDIRLRKDVIELQEDITKPISINEPVHYVLHAAGIASPVFYKKYPIETIESAVYGSKNLLELALANKEHFRGYLFFSSSEIYGNPDISAIPTPEYYNGNVSSIGPRACYDESKRLGETLASVYFDKYALPCKIVRPFNVFGPGMNYDDRRVVPMFTYNALNNFPLPVHGNGLQTRTFCYISDAIVGFLKVLINGNPGEAYNIGNDNSEISMLDLAKMFIGITKTNSTYELIPYPDSYPSDEPQRRCPDISKSQLDLHYFPTVSLQEGLRRFVNWASSEESYNRLVDIMK